MPIATVVTPHIPLEPLAAMPGKAAQTTRLGRQLPHKLCRYVRGLCRPIVAPYFHSTSHKNSEPRCRKCRQHGILCQERWSKLAIRPIAKRFRRIQNGEDKPKPTSVSNRGYHSAGHEEHLTTIDVSLKRNTLSPVAQSVEQAAVNRWVVGSSPTGGVFASRCGFSCYAFRRRVDPLFLLGSPL